VERFAVGVDLGGTNLRVAAVSEAGKIFDKVALATRPEHGREVVVRELSEGVRQIASKHSGEKIMAGIGIGVPGIIYLKTGLLRQSPNLPGWENYPVRAEIESLVGTQVFLENDANCAALGENWIGLGQGVGSLCMLTLGTGVGGGIVLEGKLWHGFLGMAGELGHIVVAENGVPCPCGGQGCLETEASATAIIRYAKKILAEKSSPALESATRNGAALTSKLVYDVAKAGDAACCEIFHSVGKYLGIALAGLVNAWNLPLYVLGGNVAAAWDLFAPRMMEEVYRRSFIFREGQTRIEQSRLMGDAGILGAAYLPLEAPRESTQVQK